MLTQVAIPLVVMLAGLWMLVCNRRAAEELVNSQSRAGQARRASLPRARRAVLVAGTVFLVAGAYGVLSAILRSG